MLNMCGCYTAGRGSEKPGLCALFDRGRRAVAAIYNREV